MNPFLLVLSSPSGGGKTSIARSLLQGRDDVGYSVSATTRARRQNERDGVDYHFLTRDEFARREAAGEFLESASYNGERYGTLRAEVDRVLASGRHAVLDIEIEGARQVRARYPNSVQVFVLPPSAEVLVQRLTGRRTDLPPSIVGRLERAADELAAVAEYQYVVVNDDLLKAVGEVAAIIEAEGRRVARQPELLAQMERLRLDVLAQAARLAGSEVPR